MATGSGAAPRQTTSGKTCAKSHARSDPTGISVRLGCVKTGTRATRSSTGPTARRTRFDWEDCVWLAGVSGKGVIVTSVWYTADHERAAYRISQRWQRTRPWRHAGRRARRLLGVVSA